MPTEIPNKNFRNIREVRGKAGFKTLSKVRDAIDIRHLELNNERLELANKPFAILNQALRAGHKIKVFGCMVRYFLRIVIYVYSFIDCVFLREATLRYKHVDYWVLV